MRTAPPEGGYQVYRVRPGGEVLAEIARRTLRDSNQWMRIYRLNPTVNFNALIPAGTTLRLPPDAAVEPADKPQ